MLLNNESNTTLWQSDDSFQELKARLATRPEGLSLVSFDFFDTIVSRFCAEPSDLFIEVGRQLRARGFLSSDLTPDEFRAARIAADERARDHSATRGKGHEVELAQIYSELAPYVVRNAEEAKRVEFEVERSLCYVNPSIISLVRHVRGLGCKTAILSDTYFRVSELSQILQDNGVSRDLFDAVIVSCEVGRAKWNGQLYHDLLRRFSLCPSEVLHVGDNEAADVHMAATVGIEGVYYYKTTPPIDSILDGERVQRGAASRMTGSLNSLRVQVARHGGAAADASRDGAMVFGPVLSRFVDWSAAHFKKAGVRKVLALMREGELLGEMLGNSAKASGLELEIVPCYASRLATALPSLPEVGPQEVAELIEGCAAITPQTILNILGLGEVAASYLDSSMRESPLNTHEAVAGFLNLLFGLPRTRNQIEAKRTEAHQLAFEYLNRLAGNDPVVGILDLGWSASIQRNIARILRRGGRRLRTVGCYLACTARSGRLAVEGDSAHGFFRQEWDRSAILPEVAITSCIGSTDRYARGADGQVAPVLGPFEISDRNRELKQQLRRGILAFQQRWLDLHSKKHSQWSPELLDEIDRNSAPILYRLLDFPTKAEAERLGGLHHDENYFGKNYSAPLCDEKSLTRIKSDGLLGVFSMSTCYWPQGVLARTNPRLLSVMEAGWKNVRNFGRLGAWAEAGSPDCGITADELSSLSGAARILGVDQIVYCGLANSRVIAELMSQTGSRASGGSTRRLLLAGPAPVMNPGQSLPSGCFHLPLDPGNPRSYRQIREHFADSENTALAFAHDATDVTVRTALKALAPFLGAHGVILLATGQFDPRTAKWDSTAAATLQNWLETDAKRLGFQLCDPGTAGAKITDWTVLVRSMQRQMWNRSWELVASDFASVS